MSRHLIKVCGVTRVEDADTAISLGANRVGVILYPKARRAVSLCRAREIARIVKRLGGVPVAVFVNASSLEVRKACLACHIQHVQLHGRNPIDNISELKSEFSLAISLDATRTKIPPPEVDPNVEYLLFDHAQPGSGTAFDWMSFTPPSHRAWLLAGGLNPQNVGTAIRQLEPNGVDVSSGVEGTYFGQKDPQKIKEFIEAVKKA